MQPADRYRGIVVVIDGSAVPVEAMAEAVQLARRHWARLHLVRLVRRPGPFVVLAGVSTDVIAAELLKQAAEELRGRVAELPNDVPCTWNVSLGSPTSELTRLLRTRHDDVVLIAATGRASTGRSWGRRRNPSRLAYRCVARSGIPWRVCTTASGLPILEPST